MSPVKIRRVKHGYRVSTPSGVHAKRTTLRNAKRQRTIINMAHHGMKLRKRR